MAIDAPSNRGNALSRGAQPNPAIPKVSGLMALVSSMKADKPVPEESERTKDSVSGIEPDEGSHELWTDRDYIRLDSGEPAKPPSDHDYHPIDHTMASSIALRPQSKAESLKATIASFKAAAMKNYVQPSTNTPVSPPASTDPSKKSFFDLPPELRNSCYEFFYHSTLVLDLLHDYNPGHAPTWSLLATCKAICQEARSTRYHNRKYRMLTTSLPHFSALYRPLARGIRDLTLAHFKADKYTFGFMTHLVHKRFTSLRTLRLEIKPTSLFPTGGYEQMKLAERLWSVVWMLRKRRKMGGEGIVLDEMLVLDYSTDFGPEVLGLNGPMMAISSVEGEHGFLLGVMEMLRSSIEGEENETQVPSTREDEWEGSEESDEEE